MYISELHLYNFLSYKEQEYKFEIGKPLLIQGINNSKDGQESNGSGKSGLQSALEYLLLKTTSRKGRDVDLIRRGEDEAIVSCKIICSMRKQTLEITRQIPRKGSTAIQISINGVFQEIATVNDGNDFILKWLDITAEDLQNFYIINKERYTSFFYSSNPKKLALISRFANIKLIDGIEDEVQGDVDEIDEAISKFERETYKQDAKLETYKEQLEVELNRDLNQERKDKVVELNEKINSLNEGNLNYASDIKKIENQIIEGNLNYNKVQLEFDKLSSSIKKVKTINYSPKITKITESIEVIDSSINETNTIKDTFLSNIESIDRQLRKINVSLAGSVVCPKCEHEFIPASESSVEELNKQKKEYNNDRGEASHNINEVDSIIEELKKNIPILRQNLTNIKTKQKEDDAKIEILKEELGLIEENLSNKQSEIKSLQTAVDSLISSINSNNNIKKEIQDKIKFFENSSITNTAVKELKKKIIDTQKEIDNIIVLIKDEQNTRFEVNQWIFNFRKFKSKLAQESLLVIQNKVNEQLKEMKSDLRLKLSGFKQLVNGDLRETISPNIIDNGEEVTFGSLSGGERVRVDFATILALQDIINQTHPYGGLDLVWSDEIGEGIDPLGLSLLMKSMPNNRTVLVTTHVTTKDLYDGVVMVENNNGISIII